MKTLSIAALVGCVMFAGGASAAITTVGAAPAKALDGTWVAAQGTDVPIAFSLKDPATVTASQLVVSPSSFGKPSQVVGKRR